MDDVGGPMAFQGSDKCSVGYRFSLVRAIIVVVRLVKQK